MFFAAIVDTLFDVTKPDSSIAKPAAIHMTKNPDTKNRKVFNMYCTSPLTSALAYELKSKNTEIILRKNRDFLNINPPKFIHNTWLTLSHVFSCVAMEINNKIRVPSVLTYFRSA